LKRRYEEEEEEEEEEEDHYQNMKCQNKRKDVAIQVGIDFASVNDCYSYSSLSLRQLTISPCTWKSNMYNQICEVCPK
jgi:hypothetical protein